MKESIKIWIYFICDLLTIDVPIITVDDDADFLARCYPEERTIVISRQGIGLNDNSLMALLAHELRHQYQYLCVYDPSCHELEPERIRNLWKNDLENYVPIGNEGYDEQSVELDAEAFKYLICLKVLSIKTGGNIDFDWLGKVCDDFIDDEIFECARECGQPIKIYS